MEAGICFLAASCSHMEASSSLEKPPSTGKGCAGQSLAAGWPVPRAALFPSRSPPRSAAGNRRRQLAAGQEQGYGAGRMKAAGITHPTPLPCPRGLPSPWGLLRSSCSAGEQGWGLWLGITGRVPARNHPFTFPSQPEAPTPNPRVLRAAFSWHQPLLPPSSTAQPWGRKVLREIRT